MNNSQILHYIFTDMKGEFAVYAGGVETLYKAEDIPQDVDADLAEMMIIGTGMVVGVPVQDADKATFRMVRGEDVAFFQLFSDPVEDEKIPKTVKSFDIPLDGWEFENVTGEFYTFDEVFGKSEENDAGETEMASADADRGLGDDGNLAGDAPAGDGGAVDATGPVADEVPGHGEPIEDDARTEGVDGPDGSGGEEGTEAVPDTEGADPDESSGPQFVNDAEVLGTETEDLPEFLAQPATFLTGELWGARDKNNTQDGKWKSVELPWGHWFGGAAGDKNNHAWGLSRHPEGKEKEGACIVLGSSVGGARKAKAMDTMFAMGLDVDSGASLDDVIAKIEKLGLLCFIYTSYNNGKSGLEIKRDEVLRKLHIKTDPNDEQIKQYLREFDKNRYEESFIRGCAIKTQKKQTPDGVKIVLTTPHLEKFRLIFPLATPVKLINLADTQQEALDLWEDKITGLARNTLGVHFDTSCTDPSRLFYTARHPKGDDNWYAAAIMGTPVSFDDIEAMKKSNYTSKREDNAGDMDDDRPPMALMPSGLSLNDWHYRYKERFMAAELLETLCPDRIRIAGGESQGAVHVECPFEHEHTSEGGTGTMAINAIDSESGYWTWFCHHDACQGKHKLQFLEEALRAGWFEEDAILNMDAGFLMEGADEEEEEPDEPVLEGDTFKTPEQRAEEFTTESTEEEIRNFVKKLFREGVDKTVRANVTAALAKSTNLTRPDIKKFWTDMDAEQAKRDREREKDENSKGASVAVANQWDFELLHEYGQRRINDMNVKKPNLFHYMDSLYVIREKSDGRAYMRLLDKPGFAHLLNTVARYVRVTGEDKDSIGVSAPNDVVDHLYSVDYGIYPELRGLVTTPTFVKGGGLLTKPGYDWASKLYYKPDITLSIPTVSSVPTEEEVYKAKALLIEEILADFPLGALTRPEIVEHALNGEGVAAVTNMMALILLPFMRDMIDGPTPGHLLVKPAPGTGASLITDVFSVIATGAVTPALAMPGNKEEMSKTLTSVLQNGQNIVFFDNINHSVDSGELASAMTTPTYQARILGKSQTIEVDVRCAWVFTGNNVTLSNELIRRLIMIDLDSRLANPEMRTGFRHTDIRGWAMEHRGELVWACLTIIQNWVAQGMKMNTETILASFENWSGMMGGILNAAGLGGFMGNREALREGSSDGDSDDFEILLELWWDSVGTKPIYVKGVSKDNNTKEDGLIELAVTEDLSLPVRKERNAEGETVFGSRGFGTYMTTFRNRVYALEDGQQVRVTRDNNRTKRGYQWRLVLQDEPPVGNVK